MERLPPLYGTCVMSMPVLDISSSIGRCVRVPKPAEPYTTCFGLAFANAMSCWTFLTGRDGCDTRSDGPIATKLIGARSFVASNVMFGKRLGKAITELVMSSV